MHRFELATYSLFGFGVSLALIPGQAHASCSQWDMPAKTGIRQSNDILVSVETTPSEGGFVGKANYDVTSKSSFMEFGSSGIVEGELEGAVEGSNVHFTIHWGKDVVREVAAATGVYTGAVGPQGRLTGTAYKAENPAETATWIATTILQCRAASSSPPQPSMPPQPAPPGWFNRADIAATPWALDDLNIVGWAQAARAATALCISKGANAGHFSGHQDLGKGIFEGLCVKEDVVWRDASTQEIAATPWSFIDVNQVSWAQANRAAERLCAGANQGFAGGHFNGQQLNGKYGLFCYGVGSQWFDATDAELAATGWGFPNPKLDEVLWAQAMRAATGFCQSKGFNGGFMNGHQAPNKYGVVCQQGPGKLRPASSSEPPARPWDERAADSRVIPVDQGQYDRAIPQSTEHANDPLSGPVEMLLGAENGVEGVTMRLTISTSDVTQKNPNGGLFNFPLDKGWAEANRVAVQQCTKRGMPAGHFNGHSDRADSLFILCSVGGVIWRDASMQEIAQTPWEFTDVNQVNWARANRAAEQLCAGANQGFAGGHFNGQQLDGHYGLFCYGEGAQWFDASDAELAATGFGFATPRLDDVKWDQAMRAATNFCVGKGFDGGFMNGHQAPNRYGVVCQK